MSKTRRKMAKRRPKEAKMRHKMAKMKPKMAKMKLKMAKMRPKMAKMRPKVVDRPSAPFVASSAHPERSIRRSHRLRTKLGPSWVQGGLFEQLLLPSKMDVLRGRGAKK